MENLLIYLIEEPKTLKQRKYIIQLAIENSIRGEMYSLYGNMLSNLVANGYAQNKWEWELLLKVIYKGFECTFCDEQSANKEFKETLNYIIQLN